MIKAPIVIGLGKVGSLVGILLQSSGFSVTGLDAENQEHLPFPIKNADISNEKELKNAIKGHDAIISCLPYHLNILIANAAYANGMHYFDLTEDTKTTKHIIDLSNDSKGLMAPQCGLAPGYIGMIGAYLASKFNNLRSIELRVGALPQHPKGDLGYAFNWSAEGVVNEYLNDCHVIQNKKNKVVPAMQDLETIVIEGKTLEAFTTSGGLGTMCDTYKDKVDILNYKTMRYPGHCRLMRFLFNELLMKEDKIKAGEILINAKPPVSDDVVLIHAAVEGNKTHENAYSPGLYRDEFVRSYYPKIIEGIEWRAISWTTAASVTAVVEMVSKEILPQQGFLKQEEIDLKKLFKTTSGKLFEEDLIS